MKMEAMMHRSKFRDYYDIYSILRSGVDIHKLIPLALEHSSHRLKTKGLYTLYATADGYADSDPVTATITWSDGTMKAENITIEGTRDKLGDVNGDGIVDVSDYIGVANIILTGSVGGK